MAFRSSSGGTGLSIGLSAARCLSFSGSDLDPRFLLDLASLGFAEGGLALRPTASSQPMLISLHALPAWVGDKEVKKI